MNKIKELYNKFIKYHPTENYNFFLQTENIKNIAKVPVSPAKDLEPTNFSDKLSENLDFLKFKYNSLINSDIVIREFVLTAQNKEYNAALIFIDGMVDTAIINDSVLHPLMLRNRANTYTGEKQVVEEFNNNDVIIRKIKNFNLDKYIFLVNYSL